MHPKKHPPHTTPDTITWDRLVAKEPRLSDLLAAAQAVPRSGRRHCNHRAYVERVHGKPSFRDRLEELVGWYCPYPGTFMESDYAWRVAQDEILLALPQCRNCGCGEADGTVYFDRDFFQ
jgi:hypothetical protein